MNITPNPSEAGRWLTYAELGRVRGISKASAERLVRRHKWLRQEGNQGVAMALVPLSMIEETVNKGDQAHREQESVSPDKGQDTRGDVTHGEALTAAINALTARAERAEAEADRLTALLASERDRGDKERDQQRTELDQLRKAMHETQAEARAATAELRQTEVLVATIRTEQEALHLALRLALQPKPVIDWRRLVDRVRAVFTPPKP